MRIDNQRLSLQEHQINVDLCLNTISIVVFKSTNSLNPFPHYSHTF